MFKNPFSFKGRIRRSEFWISSFIYAIPIAIINAILESDAESSAVALLIIPLLWFMLAQGAKRCHDRGNSGWFQIIPFYSLWMLFADSDYGPNEYGENPKNEGN